MQETSSQETKGERIIVKKECDKIHSSQKGCVPDQ